VNSKCKMWPNTAQWSNLVVLDLSSQPWLLSCPHQPQTLRTKWYILFKTTQDCPARLVWLPLFVHLWCSYYSDFCQILFIRPSKMNSSANHSRDGRVKACKLFSIITGSINWLIGCAAWCTQPWISNWERKKTDPYCKSISPLNSLRVTSEIITHTFFDVAWEFTQLQMSSVWVVMSVWVKAHNVLVLWEH